MSGAFSSMITPRRLADSPTANSSLRFEGSRGSLTPWSESDKQSIIELFSRSANVGAGGHRSPPAANRPPSGIQDLSQGLKQIDEALKKAKRDGNHTRVAHLQFLLSEALNEARAILERDEDSASTAPVQNVQPNDQFEEFEALIEAFRDDSASTAPVQNVQPNDQFEAFILERDDSAPFDFEAFELPNNLVALPAGQEAVGGQPAQAGQPLRLLDSEFSRTSHVKCGRGGNRYQWPANEKFKKHIEAHWKKYCDSTSVEKNALYDRLFLSIRDLKLSFWEWDPTSNFWIRVVNDATVLKKIKQRMRDFNRNPPI